MGLEAVSAILITLAAAFAFVNLKVLRLPTTIGLMLLALIHAVGLLVVGKFHPEWVEPVRQVVESIDFGDTLMHGMLGFLLFAGALHVNLRDLKQQTWIILTLATVGVVATTGLVGLGTKGLTALLGLDLPWIYCFLFGSLIAPTDPIAVLAIMKKVGAPRDVETKLAGESLFNDGVGVVVFLALMGVAGLGGHGGEGDAHGEADAKPQAMTASDWGDLLIKISDFDSAVVAERFKHTDTTSGMDDSANHEGGAFGDEAGGPSIFDNNDFFDDGESVAVAEEVHEASFDIDWAEVGTLFAKEAGGGLLFGLGLGLVAYLLLRWVDDYKTEVLITLAIVAGGYTLAMALHLSGPLAVVVAGLLIGNPARSRAMSDLTKQNLDTFWELVDEILNAVLFVLIGLEVLVLLLHTDYLIAGAIAVPMVLACRWLAVGGTVSVIRGIRPIAPHAVKVLTWAGLRGGISVALALSLKDHARAAGGSAADWAELILTMTYVVVAFSIIVQGLTVAPLLKACGLAGHNHAEGHH